MTKCHINSPENEDVQKRLRKMSGEEGVTVSKIKDVDVDEEEKSTPEEEKKDSTLYSKTLNMKQIFKIMFPIFLK